MASGPAHVGGLGGQAADGALGRAPVVEDGWNHTLPVNGPQSTWLAYPRSGL